MTVSTNNIKASNGTTTCRFRQLSQSLIKIIFTMTCVIMTLSNNNNNNNNPGCLVMASFITTTTTPPISMTKLQKMTTLLPRQEQQQQQKISSFKSFSSHARGGGGGGRRLSSLSLYARQQNDDDNNNTNKNTIPRRQFLTLPTTTAAAAAFLTSPLISPPTPAKAMGLVQFPCDVVGLANHYHLMRAGESLLEEQDIWETNPLFSTSREAALSPRGIEQVERTCRDLIARDFNPSVVKFSLAANAIDTSDMIANKLQVGRNRLVPEYTYLDPRSVGKWNQFPLKATEAAVWAMDATEAGSSGLGGRPPPTDDGTAHETLADQVTRLRQLISLLETQCSGDDILLIFPDGTGPALLTCLIGGIPLNRVHEFELAPGDIRLDVTYDTAQRYLQPSSTTAAVTTTITTTTTPNDYQAVIERGLVELEFLRKNPDVDWRRRLNIHQEAAASVPDRQKVLPPVVETRKEMTESRRELNSDGNMYLFGVGALGVMSVGNVMGRQNDDDDDETVLSPSSPKLDVMSSNDTMLTNNVMAMNMTMTTKKVNDDCNDPELASMEEKIKNAPINIPEMMTKNQNDDVVVDSKQTVIDDDDDDNDEQLVIAMKAMDDYLDQDDGGDAWRDIMSELMEDDN